MRLDLLSNRGAMLERDYAGCYFDLMDYKQRITIEPGKRSGQPCIRGMRVTVGTIVGLLAAGHSEDDILTAYPYLEREDLREALAYAAWRAKEVELPLAESIP